MGRWWTKAPEDIDLLRQAWTHFLADPAADVSAAVRQHVGNITGVIDAGCGGGQELLPYLGDAVGVGVDMSGDALTMAQGELRDHRPDARLVLIRATVESLPLQVRCADLVMCRLVLQHLDQRRALAEMARVLRPGGGLLVTFHHYRYYLRKLCDGLRSSDLRPMMHALRVLLTGLCFHLSGTRRPILGMSETYLTSTRLRRMAAAVELDFVAELPSGSTAAPIFLFLRRA